MDNTQFLLEISTLIAIGFELIKRFISLKVKNKKTQDYLYRAILVLISFGIASSNYFYFAGHPEVMKTTTQLVIASSGIWAFLIRLLPNKKV